MAISQTNKATLTDNGSSNWVRLPNNASTVTVGNGDNTWGASTEAAVEYTPDPTADEVIAVPVRSQLDDSVIVFTANDSRALLEGLEGFVRITVTNFSGSDPISIVVV